MDGFCEGYEYFSRSTGNAYGVLHGQRYVSSVEETIEALENDLNQFKGYGTKIDALKGDIAEFWHSGTHNIDAALKGSRMRTYVDRSHEFASADIISNWGELFGLKYYKTGADSAKAQATSYYERFMQQNSTNIKNGKEPIDFETFLRQKGFNRQEILEILGHEHQTIYEGQTKIIPEEQLEAAIEFLKQKIEKERLSRPEQVQRYQDVLNTLQGRIISPEGTKSTPLSKEEAEVLARVAKEGNVTAEEFGFNIEAVMQYEYVLQQACKAGTSAATISMVLRVAPEIYNAISYLIQTGELDAKQFQKIGFAALQGGTDGFIRGFTSAAITTCCQSGLWGAAAKSIDPAIIGAATVVMMNTMQNAFKVATGKMSQRELTDALIRDMFVSACAFAGGNIIQGIVEIPVLGYMLGSFVGSMVGSFVYTGVYKAVLSFCIDTGFTMFGLVEQDYELPKEILEEIGIDVFEYEHFVYESFEHQKFEHTAFNHEQFQHNTIGITLLRRGVIGVRKIGYI
ncbi:MAG: hypothetical protein IJA90_00810 [Peptococcaceae bacterium]|nr:hypothetical protein [Peptococcaceae bacterium]